MLSIVTVSVSWEPEQSVVQHLCELNKPVLPFFFLFPQVRHCYSFYELAKENGFDFQWKSKFNFVRFLIQSYLIALEDLECNAWVLWIMCNVSAVFCFFVFLIHCHLDFMSCPNYVILFTCVLINYLISSLVWSCLIVLSAFSVLVGSRWCKHIVYFCIPYYSY